MNTSELDALVETWRGLRHTTRPVAGFVARVDVTWRAFDAAYASSPEPGGAPLLGKWVCRRLWEAVQRDEAKLSGPLRGSLVRHRIWTVDEAVFSAWAATVSRRSECGDARYLEAALHSLVEALPDRDLTAVVRAIEPIGGELSGSVALVVVRRLVALGDVDEARRATGLASHVSYQTLTLEALAPLLSPEEREHEIARTWHAVDAEAGDDAQWRAYRIDDWARLIRLSAPEARPARARALEQRVAAIPPSLWEVCQDHGDLRGVVAEMLVLVGRVDDALAWLQRGAPRDRAWLLAELLLHLPAARREPLARTELARAVADPEERVDRLRALLPFLERADLDAALRELRAIPGARPWLLRALESLPLDGEHRDLVDEALAAPSIEELATLARRARPEHGDRLLAAMHAVLPAAHEDGTSHDVAAALDVLVARATPTWVDEQRPVLVALALACETSLDGLAALIDLVDPAVMRDRALAALAGCRASERHGSWQPDLAYELFAMAPDAVRDRVACLEIVAGELRAGLARALATAGAWGQAAVLSRSQVGWAYLGSRLLAGDGEIELDATELLGACAVASVDELVSWLATHPPLDLDRLLRWMAPADGNALLAALGRAADARPAVVAPSRTLGAEPHLRTRMWGHSFAATQRAFVLPFSWRSHSALEIAASLRDGNAVELVAWAARIG